MYGEIRAIRNTSRWPNIIIEKIFINFGMYRKHISFVTFYPKGIFKFHVKIVSLDL